MNRRSFMKKVGVCVIAVGGGVALSKPQNQDIRVAEIYDKYPSKTWCVTYHNCIVAERGDSQPAKDGYLPALGESGEQVDWCGYMLWHKPDHAVDHTHNKHRRLMRRVMTRNRKRYKHNAWTELQLPEGSNAPTS